MTVTSVTAASQETHRRRTERAPARGRAPGALPAQRRAPDTVREGGADGHGALCFRCRRQGSAGTDGRRWGGGSAAGSWGGACGCGYRAGRTHGSAKVHTGCGRSFVKHRPGYASPGATVSTGCGRSRASPGPTTPSDVTGLLSPADRPRHRSEVPRRGPRQAAGVSSLRVSARGAAATRSPASPRLAGVAPGTTKPRSGRSRAVRVSRQPNADPAAAPGRMHPDHAPRAARKPTVCRPDPATQGPGPAVPGAARTPSGSSHRLSGIRQRRAGRPRPAVLPGRPRSRGRPPSPLPARLRSGPGTAPAGSWPARCPACRAGRGSGRGSPSRGRGSPGVRRR